MKRLPVVQLQHARAQRSWKSGPVLALAAVSCLCALAAIHALDLMSRADFLEVRLQEAEHGPAAQARLRAASSPAKPPAVLRAEAKVREELSMPWASLFMAIEKACSADISLLAMALAGTPVEVSLSGEARNMGALLAFMRQLRDGGFFTQVHLRDHHIDPADPLQPVRFSVQIKWRMP